MEEDQESAKIFDWNKLDWGKKIAFGSYGAVFKGQYEGQNVAVKVMDFGEDSAAVAEAFSREVSTWTQLHHPNVAKFIVSRDFISNKDVIPRPKKLKSACCVVSEYLEGGTLASYLKNHKNLALTHKIQLALDVARGLSYLHSKRIVHRDVKLENLLLDGEKRVKIIDFGISRPEASNPAEMTANMGTKGYMAPEVLGCCPYDHKCDVFSFGICLWEIYYQKRVETQLSYTPLIRDDCPIGLARLMKNCWDDPHRRPEMETVVTDLEELLGKAEEDMKGSKRSIAQRIGCFGFLKR
ncbi:OLC1v1021302C1 [Oldenlandia corymbosa var. corymbosa]|uniref:OLC1v1021302C1 n=1 Tax=Oldenlandia corymbosa var. corymbosa TaxID=529605 RepID=A0AAV1BXT3_OLDCO|nr:OLC1v1021302C1 [Oldenlandia corymbosa var. corymbosa]